MGWGGMAAFCLRGQFGTLKNLVSLEFFLRQVVAEAVVVALIIYEDVHSQFCFSWCVESTHGDADPVGIIGIEKK